jgi:uncharacterized protein YndB with AHSA1/START domain
MATETVLVSEVIFATRERLYRAWLDSDEHSAFTSNVAEIEPVVGGVHSAFDGYASGQNLALDPNRKIVQTWRTSQFPPGAPDSHLEVSFEDTLGGTLVTVLHTGIPSGQSDQYRDSWLKHYLAPMKSYFAKESEPDTIVDLDPAALSPAPAQPRKAKPKAKAKAKAKPKAKAKAKAKPKANSRPQPRKVQTRATKKVARPAAKPKKARTKRAASAKPAAKKKAAKKRPAKAKPSKRKR